MKITVREVALALTLSAMGLTFNAPFFLRFMNLLNPLEGFAIYECINFASLSVLSHFNLVIFGIKIKSVVQTFGLWLVTFAYFLAVDMTSQWVQYVTTGSLGGASNVFLQSEDGSSFYAVSTLTPWLSPQVHYFLTFGVWGFLVALAGGILAAKKPRF
jgi:hypothetical protein